MRSSRTIPHIDKVLLALSTSLQVINTWFHCVLRHILKMIYKLLLLDLLMLINHLEMFVDQ